MRASIITVIAAGLLLGACGTTPRDRAVGGAGIGAAGGAVLGAVTGLTVVEGAALGALAGALTGVLTDPNAIDLGTPPWRRNAAPITTGAGPAPARADLATAAKAPAHGDAPKPPARGDELVTRIQTDLVAMGYDPGPADGYMGPMTAGAIRKYQADNALLTDGRASPELAAHIKGQL
ncbi:MAG: peptidoglycan-binding protein [Kiloniellaceae bacterium]